MGAYRKAIESAKSHQSRSLSFSITDVRDPKQALWEKGALDQHWIVGVEGFPSSCSGRSLERLGARVVIEACLALVCTGSGPRSQPLKFRSDTGYATDRSAAAYAANGMGGRRVEGYGGQITSVSLQRGACFGRCPVYDVTLRADGTATWNGESFVDRLGRQEAQIDLNDYGRLVRFLERAGFFGWEPEYVAGNITDLPNYYLTAVTNSEARTVHQYGVDEPADFWVIATLVDCLAEAAEWTAVAPQGTCRNWSAVRRQDPFGSSVLTVRGTCTFNTAGYAIELRRREPQGINPKDLLLDRIVHPPTGPVAEVVTDVEVSYSEEIGFEYETVTILPDGPQIPIEDLQ